MTHNLKGNRDMKTVSIAQELLEIEVWTKGCARTNQSSQPALGARKT